MRLFVKKCAVQREVQGAYPSAGADKLLLLCPLNLNLSTSLPSSSSSVGRLPCFGAGLLRYLRSIEFRGGKPEAPRHRGEVLLRIRPSQWVKHSKGTGGWPFG